MKLRTKLMLAPSATGLVLTLTLGASIWVLNGYQARSGKAHEQVMETFAKVATVRAQLGETHTQLYRTVSIAGSLDEKALKGLREQQLAKLGALSAEGNAAAAASTDEGLRTDLSNFVAQIARYQKAADSAIDLASIDPNTGVAAVQTADTEYRAMNTTLGSVVDRVSQRAAGVTRQLESTAAVSSMVLAIVGLIAVISIVRAVVHRRPSARRATTSM